MTKPPNTKSLMEAAVAVEKAKAKIDPREREAVRNLTEPLLKSIE